MNPLTQSQNPIILPVLIALTVTCFALAPQARAVCQHGCDTNNSNTFLGDDALVNNTTGTSNTAIGFEALYSNTTGFFNTATGVSALQSNTIGSSNTATGEFALSSNTTGLLNTATGAFALWFNTTGYNNTATGPYSLAFNTTGVNNTATGGAALQSNTTGYNNTAFGSSALSSNTTAYNNTATGLNALQSNTTGFENTANGAFALDTNTTGINNTAIGVTALFRNTIGSNNIAVGRAAGYKTTGDDNIDIGNEGVAHGSRTIRIGQRQFHRATFVAGISGATVPAGVTVIVDADGHLGTSTSSARYKEAINPMDKASEAILVLKPVTFRCKKELDPKGIPQFGLVAEEVEKVDHDLVARDEQGKPYTVRYEAVNAMLLNEFLKEHRKVEQITKDFESKLAEQQKQIEALTAGLQKVSAQLELSKSAPPTVLNNQ